MFNQGKSQKAKGKRTGGVRTPARASALLFLPFAFRFLPFVSRGSHGC
jgi:hypothetical protein